MERSPVNSSSAWSSNDDRDPGSPAIPAFSGEVRNLIECTRNEIRELHFRDRAHPHQCGADCRPNDSRFRYRCVDDAPFAEPLQHSCGYFESAAVNTYVFAQDEHTFILFHLLPNSLTNCFDVCGQSHWLRCLVINVLEAVFRFRERI